MNRHYLDCIQLVQFMTDEGICIDILMRVTDHINRKASSRLMSGKATEDDLTKVRRCVVSYLDNQPKPSEQSEVVNKRERAYMPRFRDSKPKEKGEKLKRMMKNSYYVRYEKVISIYKYYIERDQLNPTKQKCAPLLKDADFKSKFASERSMIQYVKFFYLRRIVNTRQVKVTLEVMKKYKEIYATG